MGIVLLLGIGLNSPNPRQTVTTTRPLTNIQTEQALTVCPTENNSVHYVVNVRDQPMGDKVVEQLPCNTSVQISGTSINGWAYIRSGSIVGYVSEKYLKR